jgi:hypothetical protein
MQEVRNAKVSDTCLPAGRQQAMPQVLKLFPQKILYNKTIFMSDISRKKIPAIHGNRRRSNVTFFIGKLFMNISDINNGLKN